MNVTTSVSYGPFILLKISPLLHRHLSLSWISTISILGGKKASLDLSIPLIIALILCFSFDRIVFAAYNALLPFFLDLASVILLLHINSTETFLPVSLVTTMTLISSQFSSFQNLIQFFTLSSLNHSSFFLLFKI